MAVKRIFTALLTEFREKGLDASALHDGYEGMSPSTLKTLCCADGQVSDVTSTSPYAISKRQDG
jgi:hypothetical protein